MGPAAKPAAASASPPANQEEQKLRRVGLRTLNREFGHKLLLLLFSSQHCLKGFAFELCTVSMLWVFRSYSVPGPQMQIYQSVIALPFVLKPIIGLVSDGLPIGGYHKFPYMLLVSAAGIAAAASLGLVPRSALDVRAVVICAFMITLQVSTCDLLT